MLSFKSLVIRRVTPSFAVTKATKADLDSIEYVPTCGFSIESVVAKPPNKSVAFSETRRALGFTFSPFGAIITNSSFAFK